MMSNQQKRDDKTTVVPLECSQEEYDELTAQVSELTATEAAEELLDCARYGEVDAVRAILTAFPAPDIDIVNTVDDGGSTALHKACANGHVSTATLLILHGAKFCANKSGNTPLHWAAASGHDQVVRLLLKQLSFHIDVLQKNEFGRSILTEGFSSQSTQIVKLLLEHDSAAEEKLLSAGGGNQVGAQHDEKTNSGDVKTSDEKSFIIHEFSLSDDDEKNDDDGAEKTCESERPLRIRELPMANADNPFGDSAVDDTTGYGIWCASLVMARWMASKDMRSRFDGKTILELGSGCGVPGLAAAYYSNASRIRVTDLNPTTVDNLTLNVCINFGENSKRVMASTIDWDDKTTWPTERLDFVIGSDLIYQESIVPLLEKVVLGLLKPETGRFLYVTPESGPRDGLSEFIEAMSSDECELVCAKKAPDSFYANPLTSRDDEDCFLHFNELSSTTYMLYEFRKLK